MYNKKDKIKIKKRVFFFLPIRRVILFMAGISLCACAATAAHDPYGDWVGTLVQDQGEDCPVDDPSFMQIRPHHMIFVPGTGALILRGIPKKSRQFYHATLTLKDARGQPYPMVFTAQPRGKFFYGLYGTPDCRAHITLHRP